jgi:hypothetical protein
MEDASKAATLATATGTDASRVDEGQPLKDTRAENHLWRIATLP